MCNQVFLIGRFIKITDDNFIIIGVQKNWKNSDGEYDVNYIDVLLKDNMYDKTKKYCEKGSIIGIKGYLEVINDKLTIIADKVSLLSNKKEDE